MHLNILHSETSLAAIKVRESLTNWSNHFAQIKHAEYGKMCNISYYDIIMNEM